MEELVIGVRFKKTGKLCYFNPQKYTFKIGDNIIAQTERGQEIGRVVKVLEKNTLDKNIVINNIKQIIVVIINLLLFFKIILTKFQIK